MAGSFKTPCPSCEADVLVKGPNLVGKKIDCPKCKYRFTVPKPDGDADDGFDVVEPKKKGNSKALVGVVLGVIGVAVVAVGAYMMFNKDEEPKPIVNKPGPVNPQPQPAPEPGGDPSKEPSKGNVNNSKSKDPKSPINAQAPGNPGNPGAIDPNPGTKKDPQRVVRGPVEPGKMKDATNLLPQESVGILRISMDRLRQTPIYSAFFDNQMLNFFENSLTFPATDLDTMILALVDADRLPFVVLRTKKPIDDVALLARMDLERAPGSPTNQRDFYHLKSNPIVNAIARTLSTESLMNDAGIPVTEEDKKRWQEKPLGLHYYDSQTLIIAELNVLARFLSQLDKDGNPPFLSQVSAPPPAVAAAPGAAGAPADPKAPPGKAAEAPGTIAIPSDQLPQQPADAPRLFADKPNFLSVKPELKQMLNRMEADEKNIPPLLFVLKLEANFFERQIAAADIVSFLLQRVFPNIKVMGIGINQLNKDKLHATILFHHLSETDTKATIKDGLLPLIKDLVGPMLSGIFGTNIQLVEGQGGGGGGGNLAPGGGGAAGGGGTTLAPPPGGGRVPGGGGGGAIGGGGGQPGEPEYSINSKITVTPDDRLAIVDIDLNINQENYNRLIQPAIVDVITQMKGRMSVLSGETTWHSLSLRFDRTLSEKKQFPQGALPRDSKPDRFGQPWPPDHRCSFFVELLPYLNQGRLRSTIQDKKYGWYEAQNRKAASTWVPELLVPYYPQTAWRAFHQELAPGVTLGATNFVGVSGIGRDSARYNPTDPEQAKLVGITGYNWGSKSAEIKDGLSNTIYLLQVPPGHNRPWIAGGGSTVMGVDPDKPMADFTSVDPTGRRGTHALMADGSVRFIPEGVDATIFKALVTRAGGETIDDLNRKLPATDPPKNLEAELKGKGVAGKGKGPDRSKLDAPELQKFQGKWKVGYMFRGGKAVPATDLEAQDMVVSIDDVHMTIETKQGNNDVVILALDPKTKSIDFRNDQEAAAGTMTVGVYELDGNKLRIRYTKNATAGQRPKEVKSPDVGAPENESYIEMTKLDTKN